VLRDFLDSHAALSTRAEVRIRFDHLVRRESLASRHSGWRAYPVEIVARLGEEGFAAELAVGVQYSSTCPASAALARQLIQDSSRATSPIARSSIATPCSHGSAAKTASSRRRTRSARPPTCA
jgi:GTP cyclohydrolase I